MRNTKQQQSIDSDSSKEFALGEIRDFNNGSIRNNNQEYKKKIVRHRIFKTSRTFVFMGVLAFLLLLIILWQKNRFYTTYKITQEVTRSTFSEASSLILGETVLTYSMDGASCMDTKGNLVWDQTYQMQSPIVATCANVVAIGDNNGNKIYVMNDKEILGSFTTGLPIKEIQVSKNGVVLAILEDTAVTWIYMYNTQGEILVSFMTTMDESGYPLSVAISDNGILVAVSYLFIDSTGTTSRVAFYNFGDVGDSYNDNLVSGYNYVNKMVPFVCFSNDEEAYAVANDALMSFTDTQIPTQETATLFTEEILSVFYGDSNIGLVYRNSDGDTKYRLDIYDVEGKLLCSHGFDMEYKEILLEEKRFIIYNDTACKMFTISGRLKFETEFEENIQALRMETGKVSGIYVTADKIVSIELE